MNTRDPQAERYLSDLRRAAARLPRPQRRELIAEVSAHVDAGVSAARSEADVRNMLDDLGDPYDIVGAAAPPAETGSAGTFAIIAGVLGVLLITWQPLGIGLGVIAVVLGVRARRQARQVGRRNGTATTGVVLGTIASVVPILVFGLFVSGSTLLL